MGVQYPFAYNEDGHLVNVSSISIERRYDHRYTCPLCGQKMRPRLGKLRARCFYHFNCNACESESYIHRVGKELLYNRFNDPYKSFIIEYNQITCCEQRDKCSFHNENCNSTCDFISKRKIINLKGLYDTSEVEKEYKTEMGISFRPDVLLTCKSSLERSVLFLELDYKHPCSEDKRHSGIPIIELIISDISDLARIQSASIFSSFPDPKIDSFPIRVFNLDNTCTREVFLGKAQAEDVSIPCIAKSQSLLTNNKDFGFADYLHSSLLNKAIDCTFFYPRGEYRCKEIKDLEEAQDNTACYAISSIRSVSFSPRAIVADKDTRFRACSLCSHFYRRNGNETCELSLHEHNCFGLFDQDRAKTCDCFTIKETILSRNNSYVEGKDYFIWVNPLYEEKN